HVPITFPFLHYTHPTLLLSFFSFVVPQPPRSTLFPYTTLFRSFTYSLAVGHSYQVAVSAKDNAGNRSDYSYSSTITPVAGVVLGDRKEHTSELQSRGHLVCRLVPEKKNVRCAPRAAMV